MNKILAVIDRLAPELRQLMTTRYQLLNEVLHNQPIGRRQLCKNLGSSERVVRSEIDILKDWGALQTTPAGIYLTPYGEALLRDIDEMVPWLFNTQALAEKLKERFSLEKVIVVPGDAFLNEFTKQDLGRAAAAYLAEKLNSPCILAVTGGTTLAQVANSIREGIDGTEVCVVPARGGLDENVELQAGTIAAKIARIIHGQYRLLHIPDNVEASTAEALKKDKHIQTVIKTIKSADILVHGIGSAMEMASRRGLSDAEVDHLKKHGAIGESLRYYYDRWGKIVFEVPGLGLEKEDLNKVKLIVAVAGGSHKAQAIEAVLKSGWEKVLITDQGAAEQIISGKDDL